MGSVRVIALAVVSTLTTACIFSGDGPAAGGSNNGDSNNGTVNPNNGTVSPNNGTIATNNGTSPTTNNGTVAPNNGTIVEPNNGTVPGSNNGTSGVDCMQYETFASFVCQQRTICEAAVPAPPGCVPVECGVCHQVDMCEDSICRSEPRVFNDNTVAGFGASVDVNVDGEVLIGAPGSDVAYIVQNDALIRLPLPSDNIPTAGASVSLNRQHALIGAPAAATGEGAIVFWERNGEQWSTPAYVEPPATFPAASAFGSAVALPEIDAATAVVGAPGGGRVVVFTNSGSWGVEQIFGDGVPNADVARFGASVAISADARVLAVGAPGVRSAFVFERNGTSWAQVDAIARPGTAGFGMQVALSEDGSQLAVGAPPDAKVLRYERSGGSYSQVGQEVTAVAGSSLGAALSLHGSMLAIGAPTGFSSVHLHAWYANGPRFELGTLRDPSVAGFGTSVSLVAGTLAVGHTDQGVHVYRLRALPMP